MHRCIFTSSHKQRSAARVQRVKQCGAVRDKLITPSLRWGVSCPSINKDVIQSLSHWEFEGFSVCVSHLLLPKTVSLLRQHRPRKSKGPVIIKRLQDKCLLIQFNCAFILIAFTTYYIQCLHACMFYYYTIVEWEPGSNWFINENTSKIKCFFFFYWITTTHSSTVMCANDSDCKDKLGP